MTRDDRVHPQMKPNRDKVGVFTGRLKNYCEMSTGKEEKSRSCFTFSFYIVHVTHFDTINYCSNTNNNVQLPAAQQNNCTLSRQTCSLELLV